MKRPTSAQPSRPHAFTRSSADTRPTTRQYMYPVCTRARRNQPHLLFGRRPPVRTVRSIFMEFAIRPIAAIVPMILAVSGCGARLVTPPPCGGINVLSYDVTDARDAEIVLPDRGDLACFVERYETRCAEMPLSMIPDGETLWSVPAEELCWVVFQSSGQRCLEQTLRESISSCAVPDLRAVLPWHGPCGEFEHQFEQMIMDVRAERGVSPETARVLTFLAAVDLLQMDSHTQTVVERLARVEDEPTPAELRRLHAIQVCTPDALDPVLGRTWIRGWEERRYLVR